MSQFIDNITIPIQIYIDPKQDKVLGVFAQKKGVSKAEVIRISIDKYLSELSTDDDPAFGIIGLGKSGKGNISEKHDEYLVEQLKKIKICVNETGEHFH